MTFPERLGALGQSDSLEAERVFQSLRTEVPGNEPSIVDRLDLETNNQCRRYLLALLSESTSDVALHSLRGHVHDKDLGARSWARYGLARITGERFQTDPRDIEEAEARLVIYPDRWRVYLMWGVLTIMVYSIAVTAFGLLGVAVGRMSTADIGERLMDRWPSSVMMGVLSALVVGTQYRGERRVLLTDTTVVGPKRNGKLTQISPEGVRISEYRGPNVLRQALRMWSLQGDVGDVIEIPACLYRSQDLEALKESLQA